MTTVKKHRTQRERTEEMRGRIMEATIGCLIDHGYHGTTISRVTERAGTSRGAHQHHFAVKSQVVIAAVEYLAGERMQEVRRLAEGLDHGGNDPEQVLDLIWSTLSGRLYIAAVELWQAARTDPELKAALVPAERRIGHELRELLHEMLGGDGTPGFDQRLDFCIDSMRGLALRQVLLGERETEAAWQSHRGLIVSVLYPNS